MAEFAFDSIAAVVESVAKLDGVEAAQHEVLIVPEWEYHYRCAGVEGVRFRGGSDVWWLGVVLKTLMEG